jgi:hypothetical protein
MPQSKDFDSFYISNLLPSIERLKKERMIPKYWMLFGILCVPMIIMVAVDFGELGPGLAETLLVSLVLGIVVSVYFYSRDTDTFVDDYKVSIIKGVIQYLNPNFTYLPDKSVPRTDYITSSLYRYGYDEFYGDDYIEGVYKNVSFHCSEVQTKSDYITGRGNVLGGNSGPDRERWFQTNDPVIFSGLFFTAQLSKAAIGCTYIWEKGFAQIPTNDIDEHYGRLLPMPSVGTLSIDDINFQEHFSVYSNYAPEGEHILTPERRENLVKLRQLLNKKIRVSFVQGVCYVAVEFYGDLFEPFSFDIADKKEIEEYVRTVNLIPTIIDYLKLDELQ